MSLLTPRRGLAPVAVIAALIAGNAGVPVRAQQGGVRWRFEDVAPLQVPAPCKLGMTLAGFEYDPQGRPVLAWREENGCGGPRTFSGRDRKPACGTSPAGFGPAQYDGTAKGGYYARMSCGRPTGIPSLSIVTSRRATPSTPTRPISGPTQPARSVFLELLVGPQTCAYMTYALAFAPGALVPDWVSNFIGCNRYGNIRLDGTIMGGASPSGPSLTVTPDGARHILSIDGEQYGSYAFYSGPAGTTLLFNNVSGYGETAIAWTGPAGCTESSAASKATRRIGTSARSSTSHP